MLSNIEVQCDDNADDDEDTQFTSLQWQSQMGYNRTLRILYNNIPYQIIGPIIIWWIYHNSIIFKSRPVHNEPLRKEL